ncbi:CTP-dependent riboflavin kinase [Candidatus Woesearchaeota archaeon]|nr:CTP-dependent riboflavin kinase [Candidatus Woesearchaeota archaeon]
MASSICGTIVQGKGKGAFFVSQQYYQKAFLEMLGFAPFPGTLNIRLDCKGIQKLSGKSPITIKGAEIRGMEGKGIEELEGRGIWGLEERKIVGLEGGGKGGLEGGGKGGLEGEGIAGLEGKEIKEIEVTKLGSVDCYKGKIGRWDAALIRPKQSSHSPDIAELIAPIHLKKELNLKDGDKVVFDLS